MKNVLNRYAETVEAVNDREVKIRRELSKIREREGQLLSELIQLEEPNWIDYLVYPLALDIAKKLGKQYEVYGPFGMRSATTIYFMDDIDLGITEQPTLKLTVTIKDFNTGELYYETGEVTDDYAKGTVGYMNGMHKVEKPLPETIEEIVKIVERSNEAKIEEEINDEDLVKIG